MKKRSLSISILILTVCLCTVGATFAWLTAASNPVINTFTVGSITITASETTGNEYKIVPGVTIAKDPYVTVKKGSEASWLYIKLDASSGFSEYMTYAVADGWTALDGVSGVYYREVDKAAEDTSFAFLKDDCILVKDSVSEEMLQAIGTNPTLVLSAYAVQRSGVGTAAQGWQSLQASS